MSNANEAEWFVRTASFAAPFCSDVNTCYFKAKSADAALVKAVQTYGHPAGLFSAEVWPSADGLHKGDKPAAEWLCNHEIERKRLTDSLGTYSFLGIAPGKFEIDGVLHTVKNPKAGRIVRTTP